MSANRGSHKNTPRLTARERAKAFLSTIGIYGGGREDRLAKAFSAHARDTLARRKRRFLNSKEFVSYLKSIGPQPSRRRVRQ